MLFKEIYIQTHSVSKMQKFLVLKQVVDIVITVLKSVKYFTQETGISRGITKTMTKLLKLHCVLFNFCK